LVTVVLRSTVSRSPGSPRGDGLAAARRHGGTRPAGVSGRIRQNRHESAVCCELIASREPQLLQAHSGRVLTAG